MAGGFCRVRCSNHEARIGAAKQARCFPRATIGGSGQCFGQSSAVGGEVELWRCASGDDRRSKFPSLAVWGDWLVARAMGVPFFLPWRAGAQPRLAIRGLVQRPAWVIYPPTPPSHSALRGSGCRNFQKIWSRLSRCGQSSKSQKKNGRSVTMKTDFKVTFRPELRRSLLRC